MSSPAPYACCSQDRSIGKKKKRHGDQVCSWMSEPRLRLESTWAKSNATNSTYLTTPQPVLGHCGAKDTCCFSTLIITSMKSFCGLSTVSTPSVLGPITYLYQTTVLSELWSHQVEDFSLLTSTNIFGFPRWFSGKESTCHCRRCKRRGFSSWAENIPWRRARQPTPVCLPGESYGQKGLAGSSLWIRQD